MKLYINDLAPWEEQRQYQSILKFDSNVQKQSELFKNASKEQLKHRLSSTNSIISSLNKSEELLSLGFDELSISLNQISNGLSGLQSSFEWGISEVIWQIEQNREILKSINQGIWHPFDAQAKNRKEHAQEAYNAGWYDDAEEYFLESEKIVRFDFSVHISLGLIYLFHKIDKQKALVYFDKAIKYASPKSAYYKSYALLYKALILFDFGQIKEAEQFSQEAIDSSSNFIEAYYQNAQYNAILKNSEKSIHQLDIAVSNDIGYCLKANNDPSFK